jgi:hypothetical protein
MNLGRLIREQARKAAAEHRMRYMPSADAPSNYPALLLVYRTCARTGSPFPVSPEHCQQTIFTRPQINWAFRFVHDLEHVRCHLSFSSRDELQVGAHQLEALRAVGHGPDSLEHKLLHADTVGQTYCLAVLGRFPFNQRRFDFDCVRYGLDTALKLEALRARASTRDVGLFGDEETMRKEVASFQGPGRLIGDGHGTKP